MESMGEKTRRLEDRLPLEEVPYLNNRNSRKRKEEIIFKEKIDEEVNINENMSLQTENTQVLSRIKEKNSYIDTL